METTTNRCHVTGKVCYGDRGEMERIRDSRGMHKDTRIYRCGYCGLLHFGMAPKPIAVEPARHRRPGRCPG